MRNVLGNDWLIVAGLLVQGTGVTLATTSINRELGGTSADFRKLAKTLGLPSAQARVPHLVIAWEVLAEVLWRSRAFRAIPGGARARLGLRASIAVLDWRSDAWHLTAPTAAAIGRHRHGGVVWRAYLAVTRRLGATHEQLPDEKDR